MVVSAPTKASATCCTSSFESDCSLEHLVEVLFRVLHEGVDEKGFFETGAAHLEDDDAGWDPAGVGPPPAVR